MPDDFGELEQIVFDQIEADRRKRVGDSIALVDPVDGALKLYSREEIRAKVAARKPGIQITAIKLTPEQKARLSVSGPLRREVEAPRMDGVTAFGKIMCLSALMIGGMAGFAYALARVIGWFGL